MFKGLRFLWHVRSEISTVYLEAAVLGLDEAAKRERPGAYISIHQLSSRTMGNV